LALLSVFMSVSVVRAGGFFPYEIGTPEVGTAAAGWAARAQDAGTAFTNPAGMARLDRSQWLLGIQPVYANIGFDTNESGFGGNNGGNAAGWVPSGGIFGVYSLTPGIKLGISTAAYFGGALEYEDDWSGRYYTQTAILEVLALGLPVAVRVNDWLSVGAGLNVLYGKFKAKTAINNNPVGVLESYPDGQVELDDDEVGYGGNFGILVEPAPGTRFGLQYLSKVDLDFQDQADVSGLRPEIDTALRNRGLLSGNVKYGVTIPRSLMFSAYHELTDQWTLLANVGWQEWSEFGKQNISLSSLNADFTVDEELNDTWHVALGFHYRLNPLWLLTGGVAYDSSPVTDKHRLPDFPEDRQIRVGVGAQYQFNKDITLGVAYEYANLGKAEIDQTGGPLQGPLKGDYSDNYANFFLFNFIQRF
jgi:long-chain fatty acid transport protein